MLTRRAARPLLAAILALPLVLAAVPAGSQQAHSDAVATAKELIKVKGGAGIFDPIPTGVVERARALLLQTNPMLGKDLNDVAAELRAEYAPRSAELLDGAARIYASRFTAQELKDALAFYKSPLGRKLVSQEAAVLDESMRNAQAWADRLSEEVLGKFRQEMKKRGHDI